MTRKRLKKDKKRSMYRRMRGAKGPMCEEEKEARKKKKEAQRAEAKIRVAKEKLAKTKEVKK